MIARQSSLVVANAVVGAGQAYLGLLVLARYLTDDVVGERAFALALVYLVGVVAKLGFPMTHVRTLARGADVAAANGTYVALKGGLTGLFMVLGLLGAYIWFVTLGRGVTDTTTTALWIAYWIAVVQSLRDVPVNTFQGLRMIRERESVLFVASTVTMACTLLVGLAYADSHGRWLPLPGLGRAASGWLGVHAPMADDRVVQLLMAAFLAGELAALALAVGLFAWRRIPIGRPEAGLIRKYVRFTTPLMLLAVGEVITKWLSQVMLGFWWDPAELGHYFAGAKFTEALMLLAPAIAIVLLPAVSQLHGRGDDAGARELAGEAQRWVSLLLWPAVAFLLLLPGPVIHLLLSDQYLPGAPVLALLAGQALLASLVVPSQMLAIGSGRVKAAARIVAASIAVTVLLGLALIPRPGQLPLPTAGLGAVGAALASLAGTALALVLYQAMAPTGRMAVMARHAGCALAAAGLAWLLPTPARFSALLAYALTAFVAYLLLLLAMGGLHRDDWVKLKGLFRRSDAAVPEAMPPESQP
jgi:O-antigen/teichoic acid export membrane protein